VTTAGISRRHALAGAATVGIGVPLLAACGGGDTQTGGEATGETSSGPTIDCSCHGSKFSAVDGSVVHGPATQPLGSASISVHGQDIEVDGQVLAQTSEIPAGGGAIFPDEAVVVTQPEEGEFKAFSAVCTHQKCTVTSVTPA
jgi:nitrite reductase/ring-hydroxylating ferredoxin subunit